MTPEISTVQQRCKTATRCESPGAITGDPRLHAATPSRHRVCRGMEKTKRRLVERCDQ